MGVFSFLFFFFFFFFFLFFRINTDIKLTFPKKVEGK